MKKAAGWWIILALVATIIMADNPFGALPGETFEEYNARRMAEVNRLRIQAGLPPIKNDAETGAEIQAALDALEDVKQLKRDQTMPDNSSPLAPPNLARPGQTQDDLAARLDRVLRGGGTFPGVGEDFTGEQDVGNILIALLARMRSMDMLHGGATSGVGPAPEGGLPRMGAADQALQSEEEKENFAITIEELKKRIQEIREHEERVRREAEAG
jgi:hypothetical protein